MASATEALPCAIVALAYWTLIGVTFGRALLPTTLVLPAAPIFGWAVHSAVALPLYRLLGFTPPTIWTASAAMLAVALLARFLPASEDRNSVPVPLWGFALAALLAAIPAAASLPKIEGDAVALSPAIFDHSKIALVNEMARLGLPPRNPFFFEAGHGATLVYYYLWHFSAAEIALLSGAGGWNADVAMTFFTAFASLSLMMGIAAFVAGRTAAALWVIPLAFAATLHPVLEWLMGAELFYALIQPPTGLAGWLFQTAWAPQHIASSSCVLLACLLLTRMARKPSTLAAIALALVVAAAFQCSTWVGGVLFAAAAPLTATILILSIPAKDRWPFLLHAGAAALLTLVLILPFLHDQWSGPAARGGGSPIAIYPAEVFNIAVPANLRRIFDIPGYWLVFLLIEFPAIYIPGVVSLAATIASRAAGAETKLASRLLAGLALVSFVIPAWFTITFADNNDLGWRAILPGVFVLTTFAAAGLSRWLADGKLVLAALALILLALALPRSFQLAREDLRGDLATAQQGFGSTPALWQAVRRHAAPAERIANNPLFMDEMTPWPINISWSLLSDRASCFAGTDYLLPFTPLSRANIDKVVEQFARVFDGAPQAGDLKDLAERYECRVVILTPADDAWTNDPFAASDRYRLVDEEKDRWKIYRAAP